MLHLQQEMEFQLHLTDVQRQTTYLAQWSGHLECVQCLRSRCSPRGKLCCVVGVNACLDHRINIAIKNLIQVV